MNWVDFLLIGLLLTAAAIGSKKGLVRELSAFVVFFAAIILTVTYLDRFAVWMNDKMGGSPLISAFLSFVVLLGLSYGLFKLCGLVFYKVANLKNQGKPDQVGGAIVGFIRGWVTIGMLTVLVFFLPMPDSFYAAFDSSVFGRSMAKTVPVLFEGTKMMHPSSPSYIEKVENTILKSPAKGKSSRNKGAVDKDREDIYRVMYQIDRFFNTGASEG